MTQGISATTAGHAVANSDCVLAVEDVEGGYGEQQILFGTSLKVHAKELVVIVGPNGAGKSTLAKSVVGLLHPWSGSIRFNGTECRTRSTDQLARSGLAYVPQLDNIFRELTVDENLRLAAHLAKSRRRKLINEMYEFFPNLVRHKGTKAGALSGGERQMVAMARAILLEPSLVVLDEPTAGLSPLMRQTVFDKLLQLRDSGVSLLVVEQNVEEALGNCDRAYVLASGATHFEGRGNDLLHDDKLRDLYLAG